MELRGSWGGWPSDQPIYGCAMQNPAKFREFAEQCKRLAETAGSEKDRKALLEIAEAWLNCAAEAERMLRKGAKRD
jgi:hypothetical protein